MSDDTVDGSTTSDYHKRISKKRLEKMVKAQQVDVMVKLILSEMDKSWDNGNPLAKVSQLYVFKALFEKSPMPMVMERAIDGGILSFLTDILEREFTPSDDSNEVLLYHLSMEILWLFSQVQHDLLKKSTITAFTSEHLVSVVTRYIDISGHFYLFSPVFSHKLHTLCSNTWFQQQVVTAVPMTHQVWQDITFYQPWMSVYGSIPFLHRCSLSFQPEGQGHIYSVALGLINEGLAWPKCPPSTVRSQSISDFVAQLIRPQEESRFVCDQGKQNMFTSMLQRSLEDDLNPGDGVREDVFFLTVLGGPYFWAYVGDDAADIVTNISNGLRKELPHLKPCRPEVGSMVVGLVDGEDRRQAPRVLRGKVVVVEEEEVMLFAVDYGKMEKVKVNCVYEMPGSASSLDTIQPQARLCRLSGVVPPPADSATVELVLTFLINLTKIYNTPGFCVKEAGGVENLLRLLQMAPPTHRLQATRLLSNMASNSRLTKTTNWTPFIAPLLDVVTEMVMMLTITMTKKKDDGNQQRNTLVASLYTLTNIMYCKPAFHDVFFQLYGHLVVINVIRVLKCSIAITRAAAAMLRTVYPGLMRSSLQSGHIVKDSEEEKEEEGGIKGKTGKETGKETGKQTEKQTGTGTHLQGLSTANQEQFSDEEINEVMARLLPSGFVEQTSAPLCKPDTTDTQGREAAMKTGSEVMPATVTQDSDDEEEDEVTTKREINDENSPSGPQDGLPETETETEAASGIAENPGPQQEESAVTFDLIPVDGGSFRKLIKKYFEFNTYVPFKEDHTHHFVDHQDVGSIGINTLTELICGMLNSQGGTIYVGLTKQGGVRGMRLTRWDRESLRLGIDNVMSRTNPMIPHTCVSVAYVPVLRQTSCDTLAMYKDVFIIEITIKAPTETVFYFVEKDRVCFQRCGTENHPLQEQDVREIVVVEEEIKYLSDIQKLRQDLQQLQEELDS